MRIVCAIFLAVAAQAQVNQVQKIAPDVYFHEGDIKGKGHCNNGWVVFEDYVLVIDANFPSGAKEIIPKIRAITDKPIRFAFDTHHHGDHAYGNQVWVEQGAVPVAHEGVLREMQKFEPGRWNDTAKGRKDVAESKLTLPTLLYTNLMVFDDGKHRVELLHFGVAHTRGDGFAWLPKEKILFTGDACVNGPFNFIGDGDSEQWVKTLEGAKKLGAKTICPGHGPLGNGDLLQDQQKYFVELRKQVKKVRRKSPEQVKELIESISTTLKKDQQIARYVGSSFPAQVEKIYREMGGKSFVPAKAVLDSHHQHAHAHGADLHGHGH
jgi:cyclase